MSKASPITATHVRTWFKGMENATDAPKVLQEHVDENVEWMVINPGDGPLGKTTPIAGLYHSREEFMKGALFPLIAPFKDGIKMEIIDVFVQPSEHNDDSQRGITKALVQMKGTAMMKNSKGWNNYYAWVLHFNNSTKKVIKYTSYLDSAAVNIALEQSN
ncbi:hypothetical protein FRB96_004934 [Tulasnella sp. 330]|nr:hypothetical protein FRB96_004934 [Tulasnella sp. 330]KAG8875587.1 hypothetical protein FRB98_007724 [Tulasnella sp. 332]